MEKEMYNLTIEETLKKIRSSKSGITEELQLLENR